MYPAGALTTKRVGKQRYRYSSRLAESCSYERSSEQRLGVNLLYVSSPSFIFDSSYAHQTIRRRVLLHPK